MNWGKIIQLYKNGFKEKIENSIRPITYYLNNEDKSCFNYWLGGTGFLLKYGDSDIFLTARHVFEKDNTFDKFHDVDERLKSFFIIKNLLCSQNLENKNTRIDIENIYLPSNIFNNFNEDNILLNYDCNDIATVSLRENIKFNILNMSYNSTLDITSSDDVDIPKKGNYLWIIGFPTDTNCFEYEEKKNNAILKLNRVHLFGKCSIIDNGIGEISIEEDAGIKDYNGLSGSPVFKVNSDKNNSIPKLAGMVVRGGKLAKKVYFISIQVISFYLFRSDTHTMFLNYENSIEITNRVIKDINDLNIGEAYFNKELNTININLINGNIISFKESHRYIIESLYILSGKTLSITKEKLYVIQELILFTNSNCEIFNYLRSINITSEILKIIKCILKNENLKKNTNEILNKLKINST